MIEGRIKLYDEPDFHQTRPAYNAMHFYDQDGFDEEMLPWRYPTTHSKPTQKTTMPIEQRIRRLIEILETDIPKSGLKIGSRVRRKNGITNGTIIDFSLDPITTYCEIDNSFEPVLVLLDSDSKALHGKTVMHYNLDELEIINDTPEDQASNQKSC